MQTGRIRFHDRGLFRVEVILLGFAVGLAGCSGGGSNSTSQPPQRAATTTTLSVSSASVNAGSSITLSALVNAASGPVSTGSVIFYDGGTSLGSATVSAAGQAGWTGTALSAGSHSLTAGYGGNANYLASVSSAVSLTVVALPTTLSLAESAATITQGLPIEFVATVADASGAGSVAPTGTITFSNGTTTLGTASVDPTGIAHFTSTMMPVGTNSISAAYSGDGTYASANSAAVSASVRASAASTYANPLTLHISNSQHAVSCADPAIYKEQSGGTDTWYLYCTSDALYAGDPNPHYINIFSSADLVNWSYLGNAFTGLPAWANVSGASLWAPAIKYFNGQYYLYYAASATNLAGNGSAIGVGTSSTPAGPFVDHGAPVVEPEPATNCCAGSYRSTLDPDEIQDQSGQRYILFGSFVGGIYVRKLSADGFTSDASSETQIAADNRYEGGNWWLHDGYYYLLASSTNCCNGPLTGYGVFVGRSTTPMGPYLDTQGIAMTANNTGGTPVLKMNGNSVLGPGGNVLFTDESGQDYILYHGVLAASPYYAGSVGYTARPGFIDAIDWVDDWPVARGGFGPSDQDAPQPMPAAQPGGISSYVTVLAMPDAARSEIAALSDDFKSTTLNSQWSFLHSTPAYTLTGSAYQADSVAYDPVSSMSSVPLLAESAPPGDYMVETELDLNLPISGAGPDYAQAGLLLYKDDSNFVRLDLYNNNDTRQIEFIKAETAQQSGYPTWGATNLGPPAIGTQVSAWLRIVKRNVDGFEHYTAYSSSDGINWIQGGSWVHSLGSGSRICLYAGNRAGFTATFHYVHVSTLQ
ncbi:MAG TPA: family 43 glycosylhydrolase [Terracidiphilus sp.]|nr:family 43 glycosylhydrolase [Terracidiphilus sp.]